MRLLRIVCLLFPIIGIFVAIGFWLAKKPVRADELLFLCFVGIFVNIILALPAILIIRAIYY